MNQRERYNSVFDFKKVDRIPNIEIGPWPQTFEGWKKEGLPASINLEPPDRDKQYSRHSKEMCEYFKLDAHVAKVLRIGDQSLPLPTMEIIEEDDETETVKYSNGSIMRRSKTMPGVYAEYDWAIKTRKDWENTKKLIFPGWHQIGAPESIPSNDREYAVCGQFPGFFWELRRWMGFEGACMAFYDDPDLVDEMFDFICDYIMEICKLIFSRVIPDFIIIDEDMAYKTAPMISPEILRRFFVPRYRKIVDYLNSAGVNIIGIDSDGLFDSMIPVLYEAGINQWIPLEIQCREGKDDLLDIAIKYPWLRLMGGVDKRILNLGRDAIDKELSRIRPLVERGGYIPHIDHSIPPCPLDNYKYYLEQKAKILECG